MRTHTSLIIVFIMAVHGLAGANEMLGTWEMTDVHGNTLTYTFLAGGRGVVCAPLEYDGCGPIEYEFEKKQEDWELAFGTDGDLRYCRVIFLSPDTIQILSYQGMIPTKDWPYTDVWLMHRKKDSKSAPNKTLERTGER